VLKAVILNGAREGDIKIDEISEKLTSIMQLLGETETFILREYKIADCLGCFGCWIKTPGQCVIDDSSRSIANQFGKADLKVFVTPIVFGGYSYELKKLLDRQISNILPFLEKNKNGEIHHPSRFTVDTRFVAIGVLSKPDDESETIFKTLAGRNALNMQAKAYIAITVYLTDNAEQVTKKIKDALAGVGIKDGNA